MQDSRHPPHVSVASVSSELKRVRTMSRTDAQKGERYSTILSNVSNVRTGTITVEAAATTSNTHSSIRDARKRLEKKRTATPGKRGIFTGESLEASNISLTLKEMRRFLPDISSVSKVLNDLKITSKKVVVVPAAGNLHFFVNDVWNGL